MTRTTTTNEGSSGAGLESGALAAICQISDDLSREVELRDRFINDPVTVLRERGADVGFPANSGYSTLGEFLASVDSDARLATIHSISSFASRLAPRASEPAPDQLAFVFVIANANAAVNANVHANANANANATVNVNTNTNGVAHAELADLSMRRLSTFEGYDDSDVARHLQELRLSRPRQLALLKRAVLDGDQLPATAGGRDRTEVRLSRYTFQGQTFEIEAVIDAESIEILDARVC